MMPPGPGKGLLYNSTWYLPIRERGACEGIVQRRILSLSFDESLNKQTQTQQMDIAVRYVYEGKSNIRYLTSQFLGCATAEDFERELKKGIKDVINQQKLSQISMDGPNVNLKLLRSLTTER